MVESAALLIDEILPEQPIREWVLSVPVALAIVYREIETHLIHKAGLTRSDANTGAVTLIQRFGSALNLNIHFHMLFLDGVYVPVQGGVCCRRVKPPSTAEISDRETAARTRCIN
jgi:hypothetical protein